MTNQNNKKMATITLSGTISVLKNVEQTDKDLKSMGYGKSKNSETILHLNFEDETSNVGIGLSEFELKRITDFVASQLTTLTQSRTEVAGFKESAQMDAIELNAVIEIQNEIIRQCKRMKCDDEQTDNINDCVTQVATEQLSKALSEYRKVSLPLKQVEDWDEVRREYYNYRNTLDGITTLHSFIHFLKQNYPLPKNSSKEGEKTKTKEQCYEEATLKSLGNDPQGTRMDVVYLAMDIYANQPKTKNDDKIKRCIECNGILTVKDNCNICEDCLCPA